jgi:competence protein ComEA
MLKRRFSWLVVLVGVVAFFSYSTTLHAKSKGASQKAVSAAKSVGVSNPLDVNSATAEELQVLPGIGPKIAERIVKYREKHGPFSSVEDLTKVKGIGEKKLDKVRPFVKVGKGKK